MTPNSDGDRLLSPSAVAEVFGVDVRTVRRWLRVGRLRGLRLATGRGASPWRIPRSEVDRLIDEARRRGLAQVIDEAQQPARGLA